MSEHDGLGIADSRLSSPMTINPDSHMSGLKRSNTDKPDEA